MSRHFKFHKPGLRTCVNLPFSSFGAFQIWYSTLQYSIDFYSWNSPTQPADPLLKKNKKTLGAEIWWVGGIVHSLAIINSYLEFCLP